jgi:hypothetical protein
VAYAVAVLLDRLHFISAAGLEACPLSLSRKVPGRNVPVT